MVRLLVFDRPPRLFRHQYDMSEAIAAAEVEANRVGMSVSLVFPSYKCWTCLPGADWSPIF